MIKDSKVSSFVLLVSRYCEFLIKIELDFNKSVFILEEVKE